MKNLNTDNKNDYFDIVLTFRNTHNWLQMKKAEKAYNSFSKLLKEGFLVWCNIELYEWQKNFDKGYVKFLIK